MALVATGCGAVCWRGMSIRGDIVRGVPTGFRLALVALGIFFLLSGWSTLPDRPIEQQESEAVRTNLAALVEHLHAYRQSRGRYPTNDEGLAVIDTFRGRVSVPCGMSVIPAWRIAPLLADLNTSQPDAPKSCVELVPQPKGRPIILGPGGVYSYWGVPYFYENRVGRPVGDFEFSPVNLDRDKRYSLAVDDGVYVYSTGQYLRTQERAGRLRSAAVAMTIGAGLILLSGAVTWLRSSRPGRLRRTISTLLVGAGLGAGAYFSGGSMCYAMAGPFDVRPPTLLATQRDLLAKYRAAGVLNEATYQRSLTALELENVLVPATKPDR